MYIWDVYMERILVYCFHYVLVSLLLGWAAMNLSVGTLTTQHVARLDTYMREHMYATVYVARILIFPKIHEDVQNMHASCSLMPLHFSITPSLIFNYSVIYFSSYKIILSHPNCNVTTDGHTSTTARERHILAHVWHSNPVVEGATFRGIWGATSLYLETRGG